MDPDPVGFETFGRIQKNIGFGSGQLPIRNELQAYKIHNFSKMQNFKKLPVFSKKSPKKLEIMKKPSLHSRKAISRRKFRNEVRV